MASLLDRMKKNSTAIKQGGGLQLTSNEELQSLAQQSGMPTTPSTPLSAEGIGANADQSKMLGTPAQQQGALRMQTREQDQLSTTQRQEQARKTSTEDEQAVRLRSMKLEGLGSLGDRVQQLATGMLNQQASAQNSVEAKRIAAEDAVNNFLAPGADKQVATDLLNKLGGNNITDEEMVQLAQSLGYTDVSDIPALKSTIGRQFLSQEEQIGAFTADKIANNISIADLQPSDIQTLGFDTIEDMAAALQLDATALQGMTLRQLQDQFGKERIEDFGKVQRAQSIIADPSTSRAEREQAMRELRELGGTGVRAAESDVKKIEEQVQKASTVEFGGQEYQVENLLKDDSVKGIVKEYLTDPEIAKSIKEKEPAFAAWIEDNKKILAAASADVDARQEAFAKVQLENMKVGETEEGNLSTDALKAIIPDYGKLSSVPYQAPPFLKMINDGTVPADTAGTMIQAMNDLAQVDAEYVQSMAGLSMDEINALGLNTVQGIKNYQSYVHTVNDLVNTPETEIVARLTEGKLTDKDLEQMRIDNQAQAAFGIGGTFLPETNLIDVNQSNVAPTPAQMRATFLQLSGGVNADGKPKTVREMLDSGTKPTNYKNPGDMLTGLATEIQSHGSTDLFRKYGNYWKNDNTFTPGEAENVGYQMAEKAKTGDTTDYYDIEKLRNSANMSPASKQTLDHQMNRAASMATDAVLQKLSNGQNPEQWNATLDKVNRGYMTEWNQAKDILGNLVAESKNPKYRGSWFQYQFDQKINAVKSALQAPSDRMFKGVAAQTPGTPSFDQQVNELITGIAQLPSEMREAGYRKLADVTGIPNPGNAAESQVRAMVNQKIAEDKAKLISEGKLPDPAGAAGDIAGEIFKKRW